MSVRQSLFCCYCAGAVFCHLQNQGSNRTFSQLVHFITVKSSRISYYIISYHKEGSLRIEAGEMIKNPKVSEPWVTLQFGVGNFMPQCPFPVSRRQGPVAILTNKLAYLYIRATLPSWVGVGWDPISFIFLSFSCSI